MKFRFRISKRKLQPIPRVTGLLLLAVIWALQLTKMLKGSSFYVSNEELTVPLSVSANPPIRVDISLRPDSAIAADLLQLYHEPTLQRVCLQQRAEARCPMPVLRARISGFYLAMLEDWEYQRTSNTTTVCGLYRKAWLEEGLYHIEILILYCHNFAQDILNWTLQDNDKEEFRYPQVDNERWRDLCLEDSGRRRLTERNASIWVSVANPAPSKPGRWVGPATNSTTSPLLTRYQPPNCRGKQQETPLCKEATSLERFGVGFRFQWQENIGQQWLNQLKLLNAQVGKLDQKKETMTDTPITCLVGWSHSKHSMDTIQRLQLSNLFRWTRVRYPMEVTPKLIRNAVENEGCTQFVVGLGQWPGSIGMDFPIYFQQLLYMLHEGFGLPYIGTGEDRLKYESPNADLPIRRVIMRSIHHKPLGDEIGSTCPPTDWRSPYVLDVYNHLIEQVCKAFPSGRCEYIDSTFVVSPMSDSARDWCHPSAMVLSPDVLHWAANAYDLVSK